MKAQEDSGNPSPAPPACIPPPPRGVTGTSGAAPPPPPPPAWNTLQPQDTTMPGSLPLSSSSRHQFPPPHPADQVMGGGRDSTPFPTGMDISHKPPSAMARDSTPAIRMDILHGQSSAPITGSVATTSWPSNVSTTKHLVSDRPSSPWPMSSPPYNWYQPPTVTVMRLDQMTSPMNPVQPESSFMPKMYTVNLMAPAMTLPQVGKILAATFPGSGTSSKRWVWHQDKLGQGKQKLCPHTHTRTSIILTSHRKAST